MKKCSVCRTKVEQRKIRKAGPLSPSATSLGIAGCHADLVAGPGPNLQVNLFGEPLAAC